MAMQKAHSVIPWVNFPNIDTPLNAQNLLKEDTAIDVIDDRVISLDITKFDKTEAAKLIKEISIEKATGIITITYYSGATKQIDTLLEKIAVNFDFDEVTQVFTITLDDGTVKEIDLSSFITEYEFEDTDTIAVNVENHHVKATVKNGSITEKHLRPDYLADIQVESGKAAASEKAAASSAEQSEKSAKLSESWAVGGTGTRDGENTDNSKYYSEQSKKSSDAASGYVTEVEEKSTKALDDIEQKKNEAVDAVENAMEVNAPTFQVDLKTGHLLFDAENFSYDFAVDNGYLLWGLTV